jgi:hypothetical protein
MIAHIMHTVEEVMYKFSTSLSIKKKSMFYNNNTNTTLINNVNKSINLFSLLYKLPTNYNGLIVKDNTSIEKMTIKIQQIMIQILVIIIIKEIEMLKWII